MPSITQTSLSVYRDNILVLDIYFEALNYETIEQKKAYELAGLLGKEAVQFAFRIDDMRRDRCFLPEVTSACNFYDRRSVPRRYKTASFMYFAAHLQVCIPQRVPLTIPPLAHETRREEQNVVKLRTVA